MNSATIRVGRGKVRLELYGFGIVTNGAVEIASIMVSIAPIEIDVREVRFQFLSLCHNLQ